MEPKDIWTVVRIEGMFQLVNTTGSNFDLLDPVLEEGQVNRFKEDVSTVTHFNNRTDKEHIQG